MRKVSMATRAELVAAMSCRYVSGGRDEKARMLDEFVALTGFHRKHAMRLLRGDQEPSKGGPRPGRRIYGDDDVEASQQLRTAASHQTMCRPSAKKMHSWFPVLVHEKHVAFQGLG